MYALQTIRFKILKKIRDTVRGIPVRLIIMFLVAVFLAVVSLVLFLTAKTLERGLYDQHVYLSWSDAGNDQGQLSVFYPYDSRLDGFGQKQLEYNIRQELIKESVISEDDRGFVTCASASGKVKVGCEGKSMDAVAIGTEGDFFRFHPLDIISGYTYTDDMLTPDMVMIDEDLAWQIFGAVDVCGQQIKVGGITHTVAGVFSLNKKGGIRKRAGIPDNLIFLSLYSLCQLGEVDGAEGPADNGSDAAAVGTSKLYGISTWEIVLPDPVKNYALNTVRTALGDKSTAVVVYNSRRFEPEYLMKNTGILINGGMQTKPFVYPYWENIALGYGNVFTIMWFFRVLFTTAAIILLCFTAISLWRRRTWTFSGLWNALMDKKYDLESRMARAHDKWEHF